MAEGDRGGSEAAEGERGGPEAAKEERGGPEAAPYFSLDTSDSEVYNAS